MSRLQPAFQPFLALVPIGILYLAAGARMFGLHVAEEATSDRTAGFERTTRIEAQRAPIYDANGVVLATDRPVWQLVVSLPERRHRLEVGGEAGLIERLDWFAAATGLDRALLERVVGCHQREGAVYRRLERGFTYAESQRLQAALASVPGTGLALERSWQRVHPQGRVFAHLLGYTQLLDGTSARDGVLGLESRYNDALSGIDGEKRSLRVAGRHGVDPALGMTEAQPGLPLHTTLDTRLGATMREQLVEVAAEWGPEWCLAMAMDVRTGALLGVEALPDFDCNAPGRSAQRAVRADGSEALLGMSFPAYQVPPGSTVKPFVVAQALATGAIRADQVFDNHGGTLVLGRRRIGNAYRVPTTPMTPAQALIHSSNVVLAQIGLKMDPDALCDLWSAFGYDTAIDLPVLGGQLSSLPPRAAYHARNADRYTIPSVTFGAELAVTPLQHLAAWQGFLNDGLRMRPYVNAAEQPVALGQAIPPGVARQVRGWLEGVVDPASHGESEGRKWLPRREGFAWGGKSGSVDTDRDDMAESSLFVAFGPVERPEVVVLVIVQRPDHTAGTRGKERFSGSRAAGPAAGRILERALELRGLLEPRANLDSAALAATLPAHGPR